jgi:DNA-binding transcriptional regulator YbjK
MPDDPRPTRQRIIDQAMRLFGEQGYAATTIAQIEAAAGLSPGSGSLYRHFPSKQALLAEGSASRSPPARNCSASSPTPPASPPRRSPNAWR